MYICAYICVYIYIYIYTHCYIIYTLLCYMFAVLCWAPGNRTAGPVLLHIPLSQATIYLDTALDNGPGQHQQRALGITP